MRIVHILQIIGTVIVIAILASTVVFAKFVKGKAIELGEGATGLYEEISSIDTQGSLPGAQAMQRTREFLEAGDYTKAREKILFITNFYSDASFATPARNILGEMNMDQVMSPSNLKFKKTYQIKKGDSLLKIAKNHNSTVENIMELNGLSYNNRIQPGQELIILPLLFETVIDVKAKTLTLFYQEQFIKEYPIQDSIISSRKEALFTKIERSIAYEGSSTIPRISSKYHRSKKLVILKAGNLQIRAVKHPDEEDIGSGFFLKSSDMEEFALLVKSGDPVEIQL